MKLNLEKCEIINYKNSKPVNVTIHGANIELTNNVKLLSIQRNQENT